MRIKKNMILLVMFFLMERRAPKARAAAQKMTS
jgi:hypothetical protein